MALIRYGDAGPTFGLVAEPTGFAQVFNIKTLWDEATVENNIGEVVTYGLYNLRWEGTLELIQASGQTLPAISAVVANTGIALSNLSSTFGEPSKVIFHSIERVPEKKDYEKYRYEFKAFVNISGI
jgi:hypothetical protein